MIVVRWASIWNVLYYGCRNKKSSSSISSATAHHKLSSFRGAAESRRCVRILASQKHQLQWLIAWYMSQLLQSQHQRVNFEVFVFLCVPKFVFAYTLHHRVTCYGSKYTDGRGKTLGLHIDCLVYDCCNSSALVIDSLQSCAKPSIWRCTYYGNRHLCFV